MIGYLDVAHRADKSHLLRMADLSLSPLRIAYTGKTHAIAIRIFAAIAAVVLLPLMLIGLAIKWWKREEWQLPSFLFIKPQEIDELYQGSSCNLSQEEFNEFLKKELARAHHLDAKLGPATPGSWRKFGESHGEYNQTCHDYFRDNKTIWPDKQPLVIQRLGTFDRFDSKIVDITADFLRVFHQKPVQIREDTLTIDEIKKLDDLHWKSKIGKAEDSANEKKAAFLTRSKSSIQKQLEESFPRKNGQYDGVEALNLMERNLKPSIEKSLNEECDLIAFTSEDLYTPQLRNFVFGCASLMRRVGIWSKARFGDPKQSMQDFEKCLIRMMKISAHEFGHMRGIPHCTDYECNIGGYMSLPELDRRPLTYCLQDSAKICSLAKITLLEYHQRLLKFFERFNERYGLNCDFSKEVQTLKGRINTLQITA